MKQLGYVYDDGGRSAAGFRGDTGDCVTRACAIVTGEPYRAVYEQLRELTLGNRALMAGLELRYGPQARRHASPRTGVFRKVYQDFLGVYGFRWVPTMGIGSGCRVHLRAGELPGGAIVARLSRHVCAVVDGVIRDTFDPSRDGTRCVYGYFIHSRDHLGGSADA